MGGDILLFTTTAVRLACVRPSRWPYIGPSCCPVWPQSSSRCSTRSWLQWSQACHACRNPDSGQDLATVIFNAYKERYHKVAGCAMGLDLSTDATDFSKKLTAEELYCTPRSPLRASASECSKCVSVLCREPLDGQRHSGVAVCGRVF